MHHLKNLYIITLRGCVILIRIQAHEGFSFLDRILYLQRAKRSGVLSDANDQAEMLGIYP